MNPPTPTAMAEMAATTAGCSSTKSLMPANTLVNPSYTCVSAGLSTSPTEIFRLLNAFSIRCLLLSVVSAIVEYAFSVAPALVRMDSSTLLYLSAPALNRDSAPIPASVEFHRALNAVLSPSTALPSIAITSPSE